MHYSSAMSTIDTVLKPLSSLLVRQLEQQPSQETETGPEPDKDKSIISLLLPAVLFIVAIYFVSLLSWYVFAIVMRRLHANSQAAAHTQRHAHRQVSAPPSRWRRRDEKQQLIAASLPIIEPEENHKEQMCPICFDPLMDKVVTSGKCNHYFHRECLTTWLTVGACSDACPICKEPLVEHGIHM